MGRAKLEMQLISKEKQRLTTFKKRKDGLIRKIHELTTLCDVNGCMIIRPPPSNQDNLSSEIEIWPENPDYVSGMIEKYKVNPDVGGSRTYTLADFYHCRSKKVLEELEKKRKKRREMVYPTRAINSVSGLRETQLRELAAQLDNKMDIVKCKIESMKGSSSSSIIHHDHHHHHLFPQNRGVVLDMHHHILPQHHHQMMISNYNNNSSTRLLLPGASIQRNLEPWEVSNRIHIPPLLQETPPHHHHPEVNNPNPPSMMKLLLADQEDYNLGGISHPSNFNIQFSSFKHEIQYQSSPVSSLESAAGQLYAYSTMPPLPIFHGQNLHQQQSVGTFMPIQYPATMGDVHHVQGEPNSQISRENEYNDFFHLSFKDHRERS